jgi:TM2 domain-containing membrane protein YozV
MSESRSPRSHPPLAPGFAWAALLLGWLVPGAGFMLSGRGSRGLVHFATILLTFGLGLALRGGVAWPTWEIKSEEFNLINNFTFIVQMGAGLPALGSLAVSLLGEGAPTGILWLGGEARHAYYELGGYFLIVAGALNYFAVGNFYDRMIRLHQRFEAQEVEGSESAT